MTPIMQTVTGKGGNCFSACLASVLDLPLSEVPNFFEIAPDDRDDWWEAVRIWLRKRNLGVLPINADWNIVRSMPGAYLIVAGMSPRGRLHSTIWFNGEMVHDPHPEGGGIEEPEWVDLLYPLDPGAETDPAAREDD